MTGAVEASLRRVADDLTGVDARWALVGGFAVSYVVFLILLTAQWAAVTNTVRLLARYLVLRPGRASVAPALRGL